MAEELGIDGVIVFFPRDHEQTSHVDSPWTDENLIASLVGIASGPVLVPGEENHLPPTVPVCHHEIDHGLFGCRLKFCEDLEGPAKPGVEKGGVLALADDEMPVESRGSGNEDPRSFDETPPDIGRMVP